jgi:hypothetical protein
MTQYVPLDGYTVTATTATSRLNMPFTSDEVAELARVVGGENVVNAPVARLEELRLDDEAKVAELALSESDFYSFLATNILYGAPVTVVSQIEDEALREKALLFKDTMVPVGVVTTHDVRLANALATSLIIEDSDSNIVLTERVAGLPVGAGLYGVSATSGVSIDDVLDGAPVVGAVAREARKSLGVDIDAGDIVIQGIGFGKTKHQPAILCHVKLSHPLSVEDIQVGDKNKRALLVAKDDQEFFDSVQMSEIARLHLSKI